MDGKNKNRSSLEEIFPHALAGIAAWRLFAGVYAVGNLSSDRYICVPDSKLPVTKELISLFDGSVSLATLVDSYRTKNGTDVLRVYSALRDAGLLYGSIPCGELQRWAVPIISLRLDKFCQPSRPFIRFLFLPFAYVTGSLIVVGLVLLISHWKYLTFLTGQLNTLRPAILYPVAALGVVLSILWHECGHALAAMRYGLVPTRLQIVGYFFVIPMFLIQIPGKYSITPARRICVWLAGPWMNLVLASSGATVITWIGVRQQTAVLLAAIVTGNLIFAAANLMPLMPNDGYFVLCTLVRRPNLRSHAYRALRNWVQSGQRPGVGMTCYGLLMAAALVIILARNILRLQHAVHHSFFGWVLVIALIGGAALHWRLRRAKTNLERERIAK